MTKTKTIWTIKVHNEKENTFFMDKVAFDELSLAKDYCKLYDNEIYKHYVNETTLIIA